MELTHIAHIRLSRGLVALGAAAALLGTPMLALAAPDGAITPASANDARLAIIGQAGNLPPGDAAPFLAEKGKELKDPVLYVESAEAYNKAADAERSTDAAEEAKVQARVVLDMVGFLEGDSASEMWQPLEGDQTTVIKNRAKQAIEDADVLIAAIEAEREAANAPPPPPPPPKEKPPGRPLIIAGSASLVLGLGGLGVGSAGLALGAKNQKAVEDDTSIVGDEYDDYDRKGKNYNTMAIVGMAVGGVGVITGAALIAVGVKKNKKSGLAQEQRPTANVAPAFALGRGDAAGLVISGRF